MPHRLRCNLTPQFNSLLPVPRLNRRGFLLTASAAGFALAAQPVMGQTVVSTPVAGLQAGTAQIPVGSERLPAYFARPAHGEGWPVVLVVQEIFGVHEHIRDVCRRLAHQGHLAIAPELFFRQGDPRQLADVAAILADLVARVPDAQVMQDLDACAAWSAGEGGDPARLRITGFCWGGRIVWLYAAHAPALKAGVAWYGRLDGTPSGLTPEHPVEVAGRLHAPVLGLYGGQDPGIPIDDVDRMRSALTRAGKPSEIVVYPDAPHAFHADYRPSYRPAEAADGWQRLTDWFGRHG